MTTGYPGKELAFQFLNAEPKRISDLPAADSIEATDLVPIKNGTNLAQATVQKVLDAIHVATAATTVAAADEVAINQSGTTKKTTVGAFSGFELSATFAAISATDDRPRIVLVTTDETNSDATTIYFKNGTDAAIKLS